MITASGCGITFFVVQGGLDLTNPPGPGRGESVGARDNVVLCARDGSDAAAAKELFVYTSSSAVAVALAWGA